MISIPGKRGRTCDGWTRRELLRVGGAAMLGLSLPEFLSLEALASTPPATGAGKDGFGNAKSVILIFLQGGPSHIDIWDPKPDAPANIRGEFKAIPTKVSGIQLSEVDAEAGAADRQGHAHPLRQLHAGRPVQSHGGACIRC